MWFNLNEVAYLFVKLLMGCLLFTSSFLVFLFFVVEECGRDEFQCNNGRCLDIRRKCNNYDECGDGSDEIDCGRFNAYCN